MAGSVFTGPVVALGTAAGQPAPGQPQEYSQQIGPSILFGGIAIPDQRGGSNKDNVNPGSIRALYLAMPILTISDVMVAGGIPLTVAGNATLGLPLVNVSTYAAGLAVGLAAPPYASSGGVGVNNAIGLDIGWSNVATTALSNIITPPPTELWRYYPGLWVTIGGAGVGGAAVFARVTAVGTTTVTLDRAMTTAQATAPVGPTRKYDANAYGNFDPTGYSALMAGGMGRFLVLECTSARGVGVTGVASGVGGPVLIEGRDMYDVYTSEIIAATAGATTVYGKKTYKVFLKATPQFNDNHNYTVIQSDLIGLPFGLMPGMQLPQILFGAAAPTVVQWQAADLTNPATTSTGDPRGAVQLSTKGPLGGVTFTGPDGATRLQITQTMFPSQMISPFGAFGVPPV